MIWILVFMVSMIMFINMFIVMMFSISSVVVVLCDLGF